MTVSVKMSESLPLPILIISPPNSKFLVPRR